MKSENSNEPLRKPPTRKLAFSHPQFLSRAFPCCLLQCVVRLLAPRPHLSTQTPQNFCRFPKIGPGKNRPQKLSRFQTLRKELPWIYLASTLQISHVGPNQSNFLWIFHGVLYFRFGGFVLFVFLESSNIEKDCFVTHTCPFDLWVCMWLSNFTYNMIP